MNNSFVVKDHDEIFFPNCQILLKKLVNKLFGRFIIFVLKKLHNFYLKKYSCKKNPRLQDQKSLEVF